MTRLYFSIAILLASSQLVAQENAATQKLTEQFRQFEEQVVNGVQRLTKNTISDSASVLFV